jgi:DNA repair protein RadC
MATNIELLKEDIATMQEVMDDSSTPQNVKDAMKQPLMEAKKQLAELESDKGKEVVKSKMTVSKIGKLEKPKSEKPKAEKKGLSALQKCQELLAKYTNEKKTAQERIDKRKASGKPAELTPAETIAKASKVVGSKIKDIKESDKKLTKTEIQKIVFGIEETIKNTISAIVENDDREYFIEQLINYLEDLDENFDLQIQNLLGEQYTEFVEILGKNINDKKFRKALFKLEKKNKVNTEILSTTVDKLIPTQNEIDVEKSLLYPLTSEASLKMYLTQKTPIKIKGIPIITSNKAEYIIDGHHRWSQIYVVNPSALISCLDLSDLKNPFDGLKASQLAIATDLGKIPIGKVEGMNLLTISEKDLKKYVNKTLTAECREIFEENNIMNPANHIWENVKLMQKNNQPIEYAPSRKLMPQTDEAKNFEIYLSDVSKIKSTNFRDGGKVEEHNIDMLHNLGTQIKHHSYELMKNIHKNDDVEAWVVSKAQRASTDLSDITHYLEGQKKKFDIGGVVYPNLSDMKPSVVSDAPTYDKLYKKKGQLEIGEYAIQEVDLVKVGNKILSHDIVKSPASAVEILRKFWNKNSIIIRESAYAMFLNRANEVIAIYEVGKGGITGVVMDPELIASVAVKSFARGVIIAHNHPSGNLIPSPQDIEVTNKIKQGLKFLDIQLLDHFIITENSYYSFADEGRL